MLFFRFSGSFRQVWPVCVWIESQWLMNSAVFLKDETARRSSPSAKRKPCTGVHCDGITLQVVMAKWSLKRIYWKIRWLNRTISCISGNSRLVNYDTLPRMLWPELADLYNIINSMQSDVSFLGKAGMVSLFSINWNDSGSDTPCQVESCLHCQAGFFRAEIWLAERRGFRECSKLEVNLSLFRTNIYIII